MFELALTRLTREDPRYPIILDAYLGAEAPPLTLAGDPAIAARTPKWALFCSARCPGVLLDRAHDLAQALRREAIVGIGGFHSPTERECLRVLLQSPHPVIVCLARGCAVARPPPEWRQPLAEGRLLLVSALGDRVRRPTAAQAHARNRLAAAWADRIVIAHARPGSALETLAAEAAGWRKRLLTLDNPQNANLLALGAHRLEWRGDI